jgi:quercetin dioxygenase-like cupin family protein
MMNRRELLLGLASLVAVLPGKGALATAIGKVGWNSFMSEMWDLAQGHKSGKISQLEMEKRGLALLANLDTQCPLFLKAVENSFESGNLFWMWQRLVKERDLNGGILNIEKKQIVKLHDHPGATGMVRVISGETEAWLFDRSQADNQGAGETELKLLYHGILRPGDTAKVTPGKGNIHALRAVSDECAMLDFFIPPYDRSQRFWFEPTNDNWFNKERVSCLAIPQKEYGQ